ncbi:ABC transporter ATP-binding protein [Novibacillus thermophilus]|uniref:Bacitracin ABC transporter ATP-binding protein n=1 Tax=Novibacillus thermophilus TaxID=1471761 RepID=A0A1U9K956_9BACL|nr:ABC transporter ATP-binding protein [Novibacillus thermophilus]AQS56523.1 bacitracin ABC transporter ATP-binding protein [Novibacillus thermophilus]
MTVLRAKEITKVYEMKGGISHKALDRFSIAVEAGEFVGVMGPSGSGKTTLLNILATIDTPTSGRLEINGVDPSRLKSKDLALFRRRELGFIFQDFNLLDTLSIKENMMLPLVLENVKVNEVERRVHEMAELLGIGDILDKRTYEVSGGQQQRAAAARALIHEPAIVLADEPTGNLDSKAANDLLRALAALNEHKRATIVMVTHDPDAASFCERVAFIRDGRLFSEMCKKSNRQAFLSEILDALPRLGGDADDVAAVRV